MQTAGMAATSVVPLMRYRDCATAIDWLVRAFGFERHFVLGSEDGKVVFAQLTCGSGMIMVGPVGDSDLDDHLKQPDEVGGAATQSCYLAVDDIEEHYRRARACGAEIVLDLKGAAFGSQGYSCRDLEGHIWNFGSYDPWRGKRQPEVKLDAPPPRRRGLVRDLVMLGLCGSALLVAVSTFGKGGWSNTLNAALGRPTASAAPALPSSDHGERLRSLEAALLGATADINATRQKLNGAESGRSAAEAAVADLRLELERERAGRLRAEEGANAAVEKIAEDVRRELAIEKSELDSERTARQQAEAAAAELRAARASAEVSVEELKGKLKAETEAREAAEAEMKRMRGQATLAPPKEQSAPSNAAVTALPADDEKSGSAGSVSTTSGAAGGSETAVVETSSAATAESPSAEKQIAPSVKVRAWERQLQPRSTTKRSAAPAPKPKPKVKTTNVKPSKPKPKPAKAVDKPILNVL